MGDSGKGGRIVVGVDDSSGSRAALAYALREGELRGAEVEVVGVFARAEYWSGYSWSMGPSIEELRDRVQAGVDRMISEVRSEVGISGTGTPVVTVVAAGSAAPVLLNAAGSADLLVVGSRGQGGFASMVLGSVSLQCVLHAPCPVTVVPAPAGSAPQDQHTMASAAAN